MRNITGFNGTRLSQLGFDNTWDYFWGKRKIDENAQEMTSSGKLEFVFIKVSIICEPSFRNVPISEDRK